MNILSHEPRPAVGEALIAPIRAGASFGNPVAEEAALARIRAERPTSVETVADSAGIPHEVVDQVVLLV